MKKRSPICIICNAYMLLHKTNRHLRKCPTCGYCMADKELITQKDYFMGRDETCKDELTDQIKSNSVILLNKVNSLLHDLNVERAEVSSGWRPASINGSIPTAAKKSAHLEGMAVDLKDDKEQKLGKLILSRPDLLELYDLWLEDLDSTKGKWTNWVHLDTRSRSKRPIRVFKP